MLPHDLIDMAMLQRNINQNFTSQQLFAQITQPSSPPQQCVMVVTCCNQCFQGSWSHQPRTNNQQPGGLQVLGMRRVEVEGDQVEPIVGGGIQQDICGLEVGAGRGWSWSMQSCAMLWGLVVDGGWLWL